MPEVDPEIAGLVLAAGGSTRLGRPKQLVQIDGVPLVRRAVLTALGCRGVRVLVVVGANQEMVAAALAGLKIEIVHNGNWREGIGSSIRTGIERIIQENRPYDAVMILLADQYKIESEHLERLIEAFHRSGQITASEYDDTMGVPALFPRNALEKLRKLTGDTGARALLRNHGSEITRIPCPQASFDLDTLSDIIASFPTYGRLS
jgi:CTP:molybdopterin cytidylyltransferase MocA